MRTQPFLIVGLALLGAWIVQPDPPREVWGHDGESALLPSPEDETPPPLTALEGRAEQEERQVAASLDETRRDEALPALATPGPLAKQVFGVCIDANGAPCEGAWVLVQSTPDPVLAARRSEPSAAWLDEQRTDANGRFFFESPKELAAGTLTVRLEKLGYAPVEWQVQTAPTRAHRINLQAVQLERTAFLHGSVVDSSGQPLPRGWTVHARRLNVPEGMHRVAASHTARPAERRLRTRRGHFELSSLAPGTYELITQFIDGVVQRGPEFEVIAGEERTVQITRRAPSLKNAVLCELQSERPLPSDLAADGFALTSSAGQMAPLKLQGRSLVAYGLEEQESYTLEVRDDRFAPSRLTDLRPGGLPRTWKLLGAESLQVDVRSALTGERIDGAWIQLAGQEAAIHTLQAAHEKTPASALHEGFALSRRRPTLLLAGAPGWVTEGPLELQPDSLQPHRTVEIRLRPGTWIQGRFLVRGSTEPFPHDLDVYVHELSLDGEHWQSAPTVVIPSPGRGDGRFVLEALPHGKLLLEARSPEGGGAFHGSAVAPALALEASATPLGVRRVRIELDAPAQLEVTLTGLVQGFDGREDFAGYEARLVNARGASAKATLQQRTLTAGPLAPGRWQLELWPREKDLWGAPPLPLGSLSVSSGRNVLELQARLPARVAADLRVDGFALAEATVELFRAGERRRATTRIDGIASLGLVPGGEHEVFVHGPSSEPWTVQLPGLLHVKEGDRLIRAIDLQRIAGELLLIDGLVATDPLREALVVLSWRSGDEWREQEVRTDRRGFLHLDLPAGTRFVLSREGRVTAHHSRVLPTIEWTPNGPSRSVLRLPH